jgi:tetratricopeptide (TPR) repeat protein
MIKKGKKVATIFITILFGILFTLIFIELNLLIFGKLGKILQKTQNNFSKKDEFVILALGESTTAPVYNLRFNDYSWPAILEKLLNEKDLDKKIKVINEGEIAIDSNKILNDLENNLDTYNPNLVISIMGINDFFGGVVYETTAGIEPDDLLSRSRTYKLIKFLLTNIKDKHELKNRAKLDCDNEQSCLYLASTQKKDDFIETELSIKFLEKALKYNPNNIDTMIQLGYQYMYFYNQNKDDYINKAIAWFEQALEYDQTNPEIYLALMDSLIQLENAYIHPYRDNSENKDTIIDEEQLNEKIKKNIKRIKTNIEKYDIENADLFILLANYEVCTQDTCCETEPLGNESRISYLNKALAVSPENPYVLFELARYHAQCDNVNETEKFYLQILETHTNSEIYITTLIELANIYLETNREELANTIFKQAIDMGGIYVKNYKKLYETLASKNIQLIAAQYPTRSIEPLELIFKNNKDVLLVDNELLFKNEVKEAGYEQIFIDRAAGNFGHCSEKGNLLLAENIASVILENWEEISGKN